MKRIRIPALAMGLAALLATAADAEAGRFGRDRDKSQQTGRRTEKTEDQKRPRRFNRIPEMTFVRGQLVRTGFNEWRVEGMDLVVRKDCVMTQDGGSIATLEEGREVLVTGVLRDGVLEAWGLEVQGVTAGLTTPHPDVQIVVSDYDPTVGEIISSPY